MSLRVTVWHEYRHEKTNPKVSTLYPNGMHEAIASFLRKSEDLQVTTATLDEPEAGLTEEKLNNTDVLTWWGHMAHSDVQDLIVERVYHRVVRQGMGLVVLHSGHFSKIFRKLMGTTCDLKWREAEDREILWVTQPGHPIVAHIDDHLVLEHEEMYGEFFDIPEPDSTFLISSFTGGEVFRSGCTWTRGAGKIVYFRPGHETYPSYHNPQVLKVIENACRWAAPTAVAAPHVFGNRKSGWMGQTAPTK
jgi:trehalose utilization protein